MGTELPCSYHLGLDGPRHGQVLQVECEDMSAIQDLVADTLDMQRGLKKSETGLACFRHHASARRFACAQYLGNFRKTHIFPLAHFNDSPPIVR